MISVVRRKHTITISSQRKLQESTGSARIVVMSTSTLPRQVNTGGVLATDGRKQSPVQHDVCITGTLRIDGRIVTSARAVELLHLMSHEGPVLPKKVVEARLYGGYCSRSSLWYPLKICQRVGIAIFYDTSRRSVVLEDDIRFDVDIALDYLAADDARSALWMLGSWPARVGGGSYSATLKKQLGEALMASLAGLCWAEIDDVFQSLDHGR